MRGIYILNCLEELRAATTWELLGSDTDAGSFSWCGSLGGAVCCRGVGSAWVCEGVFLCLPVGNLWVCGCLMTDEGRL